MSNEAQQPQEYVETESQTDPRLHTFPTDRCNTCMNHVNADNSIRLVCDHTFCKNCLLKFCKRQMKNDCNNLVCPICLKVMNDNEIQIFSPDFVRKLNERTMKSLLGDGKVSVCPNCQLEFILEPETTAGITKDQQGRKIPPKALECLRLNRCNCPKCHSVFCNKCKKIPFHEGYTCEEQKLIDMGNVCRFCGEPITNKKRKDLAHKICKKKECKAIFKKACHSMLPCGHPCCGTTKETTHFGCAICDESYCVVCGEICSTQPSITQKCGHKAHLNCVVRQFEVAKDTGLIQMPKCGMPGCNCIPSHPLIQEQSDHWETIHKEIETLIKQYIILEHVDQEAAVTNHESEFHGNSYEFAKNRFLFYMCEKCNHPYFGGHKECGIEDEQEGDEYVCSRCNRVGLQKCPTHGEEGMVYKCYWCCNQAVWFCLRGNHYCDECHKKPGIVKKGPWPKCDGTCQFAPHIPNGTAQPFGYCAICESEKGRKHGCV